MRKFFITLGLMTVIGLCTGSLKAGDQPGVPSMVSIVDSNGQVVSQECDAGCNGGCACEKRCRACEKCKAYYAAFGYFNCNCRGSYKFPVPPQYTYHWPGMYSQQTMTEYTSPYRFPPLNLPPDMAPPPPTNEAPKALPTPNAGRLGQTKAYQKRAGQIRPAAYTSSRSPATSRYPTPSRYPTASRYPTPIRTR